MSKPQTLALARAMLRAAHQFADANFRECVSRWARLGCRGGATLTTAARRVLTRSRPVGHRYAERRVLQGFREHAALKARAAWARRPHHASGASPPRLRLLTRPPQDRAAIDAALTDARQQLEMLRRQVRSPAARALHASGAHALAGPP